MGLAPAITEVAERARTKKLKVPVLTCIFEDWKDEARTPKVISFFAKRARGAMARYLIEQRVETPQELKSFSVDRYTFQPDRSTEDRYVFGRPFVSAAP